MNAVSRYFTGTKEVDIFETVRLSLEASTTSFTIEELTDAIIVANPQDDLMKDVDFVRGQVRRAVIRSFSNEMIADYFICDAMPDGRYIRHGVEIVEEPVLVALHPTWEGSEKYSVAVLAPTSSPLAKDEMDRKYCQSQAEAEAYIAEKYPHAIHVGWQEIFAEYRTRVAKSGISFETRSHLMR